MKIRIGRPPVPAKLLTLGGFYMNDIPSGCGYLLFEPALSFKRLITIEKLASNMTIKNARKICQQAEQLKPNHTYDQTNDFFAAVMLLEAHSLIPDNDFNGIAAKWEGC